MIFPLQAEEVDMNIKIGLSVIAIAAFVGSGHIAMAQQNNTPTDPTAPSAGVCTGFPGDPATCPQDPSRSNTTIPEDPNAPDINTQSGQPNIQTTPDLDDRQQLPTDKGPDVTTPTPE
jgi:hypothetical protein